MSKDNSFRKGQAVAWHWGNGRGTGKVAERFEHDVTRTIEGSAITRKGSKDDPAYLVKQKDGGRVLKLGSELSAAG